MDILEGLNTSRRNTKCLEPVITAIGEISCKPKVWLAYSLATFIKPKCALCDIDLVFHFWVWTNKKGDPREDETKKASNIGQNNIYFSNSSSDSHSLSRLIDIHWHVFGCWDRNRVCLEALNVAASSIRICSHWKRISVSLNGEFSHIDVAYSSNSIRKSHEYILFDDISDGIIVIRRNDSIYKKESNFKVIIISQISTHIAIDVWCWVTCRIYCCIALHYLES